jgi:hypothetical protein
MVTTFNLPARLPRSAGEAMSNNTSQDMTWPFDVDLSALDTGSITNIILDIENHLPLLKSEGDMKELLRVKKLFEEELMESRRLH